MKRIWFLWAVLFAVASKGWSFDFDSYRVGLGDGLVSTDIRTMTQDDKGYIWFGSTYGLLRYDGFHVHTYLVSATGNNHLLYDNHIRDLIYWKEGLVVVRVQGQYCTLFDTRENRFVPFPISNDICTKYNRIWLDLHKTLWLFNDKGQGVALSCNKRKFSTKVFKRENSVPQGIRSNHLDNQGNNVRLINNEYLEYIDRNTRKRHIFKIFDQSPFSSPYVVRYEVLTVGDNVWVSTYGSGITVYNKRTGEQTHIRKGNGNILQTNFIITIKADRQGNIWALQDMQGAVCISTETKRPMVVDLSRHQDDEQGNHAKSIIRMPNGGCFVSTNSGEQMLLNAQLKVVERMKVENDAVLSMYRDNKGVLYLGTRRRGLSINGVWYKHDDKIPSSLSDNKICGVTVDHKGRVWVATQNGNVDVGVRKGCTYYFSHRLPRGNYKSIMTDHRGNVWVGSETVLYRFNPDNLLRNKNAYHIYNISGVASGVNDISHVMEDRQHRIWIGTMGKGVFWTDNSKDTPSLIFNSVNHQSGLVNDMVTSIIQDRYDYLWIATEQGITVLNPKTGRKRSLFTDRSSSRNFYTDRTVCQLLDGRLVFGTINGLVVYTPQRNLAMLGQDLCRPSRQLLITDVMVNGNSIFESQYETKLQQLTANRQLKVRHDENSLTFRFSDFNYEALSKTSYSYILEGYDEKWSPMSTTAMASYRDLPYGHYRFRVRAYQDDMAHVAEYAVDVVIMPPLWLTWWAILGYCLLALALGMVVYKQLSTVYRLRQRITLEKQMTDFKLRFFTDISHEFRTPLTIIHGAIDRIMQSKNLSGDVKQPLSSLARNEQRMMRLINQLLEFRKMENGKLRLALQQTDVVSFLHNIFNDFKEIADNKRITFLFMPQVKTLDVYVDRGHLDKIAYNLLGNAFKYTPVGGSVCLKVAVDETARIFSVVVTDTGVGVSKEKQKSLFERFMQSSFTSNSMGIGLNLTRELVRVHKGTIFYTENLPQGSIFTVTLPLDKDCYAIDDFLVEENVLDEDSEQGVKSISNEYLEMKAEPFNDKSVLVVEDDVEVLKYIKTLLSQYFTVYTCADGEVALKFMEETHGELSLVVTDIMMPGINGYELVRRMKAHEDWQVVPIVMLTAISDMDGKTKGIDLGIDAYISKPFDNRELVSTCCNLIQKYDLLKHRYAQVEVKASALPKVIKDEKDKQFIDVLDIWIDNHLSDTKVSVDMMAEVMEMGRTAFYEKVRVLTGMTPNDYLRKRRMERAASLLASGGMNISQVAYEVGFVEPHYFSRTFKQYFGVTPKKYQQGKAFDSADGKEK